MHGVGGGRLWPSQGTTSEGKALVLGHISAPRRRQGGTGRVQTPCPHGWCSHTMEGRTRCCLSPQPRSSLTWHRWGTGHRKEAAARQVPAFSGTLGQVRDTDSQKHRLVLPSQKPMSLTLVYLGREAGRPHRPPSGWPHSLSITLQLPKARESSWLKVTPQTWGGLSQCLGSWSGGRCLRWPSSLSVCLQRDNPPQLPMLHSPHHHGPAG
jgi:hypothetical protein